MIMDKHTCKRRQIELAHRRSTLEDMVEKYPIIFHDSTPTNFKCIENCGGCCTTCYFFNEEYLNLPKKYHNYIYKTSYDRYQVKSINNRCVFSNPKGCHIQPFKPIRCKIYPYFFVVDETQKCIYVMVQSFSDWPNIMIDYDPEMCSTLCPGLFNGPDITKEISNLARPFLRRLLQEREESNFLHFFKDTEILINKTYIKLYLQNLTLRGYIPYMDKSGNWME
jgi:Fe-S-cluster containining protein